MLHHRPALLAVAAQLNRVSRAATLHDYALEKISAQLAIDVAEGSVESKRSSAVVSDGWRDQHCVFGERWPFAKGEALGFDERGEEIAAVFVGGRAGLADPVEDDK